MIVLIRCIFCQLTFHWSAFELWPNPCPRCGGYNGLTLEPGQ
jgi:hypothetical protein